MVPTLKIRLLYNQVEALKHAYDIVVPLYDPANDHEQLLYQLAIDMQGRMRLLAAKEQHTYRLCLTPHEALAFYQFWGVVAFVIPAHSDIAVQFVFATIDKRIPKQLKSAQS